MPAKFRKEIANSPQEVFPEILRPELRYSEQLQIFLPQDERHRYNLLAKLVNPPKTKLDEEDDW